MSKPGRLKFWKLLNLWPPFLGAGIKVKNFSKDRKTFTVQLKERFWNRNSSNSHYGGSIFSMTDPFFALILIDNLGQDYIIVDKSADIRFKKRGKGTLTAVFNISAERVDEIKNEADTGWKSEPKFTAIVRDETGDVVAEVDKVVYVRRKDREATAR